MINIRVELNKERELTMLEKTKLKEMIKRYEAEFFKFNNRQLSKEDREYHKEDFERYKVSFFDCFIPNMFFLLERILSNYLFSDRQSQVEIN